MNSQASSKQLQKVLQPVSNNNLVVQQAGFAANTGGTNTTNTSSAACSAADVTLLTDTAFEGDFKTGKIKNTRSVGHHNIKTGGTS